MAAGEHAGHRKRLDEKSYRIGFEGLEEHEQLEKLLFVAVPQGNTNEMAHKLLNEFGSLYHVLTADTEDLIKVPGVGNRVAQYLHDLVSVLGCVERCILKEGKQDYPSVQTPKKRGEYAKTLFYGKLSESFYMVSVNSKYQAYRFDHISDGSDEEIAVYVQSLARLALRNHARRVFLAHNHPSGLLKPSGPDYDTTRMIKEAFKTIGVELIDHVIVGHGDYVSMKEWGVM